MLSQIVSAKSTPILFEFFAENDKTNVNKESYSGMVNSEGGLYYETVTNPLMQGPKIIHILLLLARRLSSLRSSVGEIERHKLALQFAPICAAGAPALFALFLTKTNITLALGVGEREGGRKGERTREVLMTIIRGHCTSSPHRLYPEAKSPRT